MQPQAGAVKRAETQEKPQPHKKTSVGHPKKAKRDSSLSGVRSE
jgi:hypothetical protein